MIFYAILVFCRYPKIFTHEVQGVNYNDCTSIPSRRFNVHLAIYLDETIKFAH
jgi:hypothetical protein